MRKITVKNARANNLKGVSLEIPHNKFIVVTGISGSGKSSLAFEVIAREGQRRYFETMPGFARQFLGKLNQSEVEQIHGLSPVIAIAQKTTNSNARSTVGTMSDVYDFLRLLFARFGRTEEDISLSRSLFSFNSETGKCLQCNGIGKEEKIDRDKLIADGAKTLREGALTPTLPTGYIMYSQVTIDALNQVCEAEGFDVDIPWDDLTIEQRDVILFGSEKIKVPFGKHSIESRLKWTGIKAKPREEGFYKGMIPIMSDILRRDRNPNILKYVSAVTCSECKGDRLNKSALNVRLQGETIASISSWEIRELQEWMLHKNWDKEARSVVEKLSEKLALLNDLGLGHLRLDQRSESLSASEAQRIRVINQITAPLSNVLYVLDEPSIGLHPDENQRMIRHLRNLVAKGNTVMVVEHDLETIRQADWIVDMGPGAGENGGKLLFNGLLSTFLESEIESPTRKALLTPAITIATKAPTVDSLKLRDCTQGNLKGVDVEFLLGATNVVSGRAGSGARALVDTLLSLVQYGAITSVGASENVSHITECIFVDQSPIGRTPRSNPATYLGISDGIRDLFASLPESKERQFTKSHFSFNNKGGRCEKCHGAGKTQIGMHFLGMIELICDSCGGKRFNDAILEVHYNGLNIADVYGLSVNEAWAFFKESKDKINQRIARGLEVLLEIGLGYLSLGQSSTTLSGGEAQRIKIANQLLKKRTSKSLYVLIEPSIGLHDADIGTLVKLFDRIKSDGSTIVCLEQDSRIIATSDWLIELGPEGGSRGGNVLYQGIPRLREKQIYSTEEIPDNTKERILLQGVTTNGLKKVNVSFPKEKLSVVTGLSGSGKSSLVYDTLFAEANARFSESLSTYSRSLIQQNSCAELEFFDGLTPAIALGRRYGQPNKRSTVGTLSGIYDHFRILFSRLTGPNSLNVTAQHFSFNHPLGACERCEGTGTIEKCSPSNVIVAPSMPLFEGALAENKALRYYSNPNGQFVATLEMVARTNNWDLSQPWDNLSMEIQEVVLYGTGDTVWNVTWNYKNKSRTGVQELETTWRGFCGYVDDEYSRKRKNKNIGSLKELLAHEICDSCQGQRLKKELLDVKVKQLSIADWMELSIEEVLLSLVSLKKDDLSNPTDWTVLKRVLSSVENQLRSMMHLGLGYLSLNRSIATLSGGEYQRVLLAGQLAANLSGVTYIMDEPTVGLDAEQIKTLREMIRGLLKNGNTVIVVEHDPAFIRSADYLVEMGPGSGELGGEVVFQGRLNELRINHLTYGLLHEPEPQIQLNAKPSVQISVHKACANNLKDINVSFELNSFTAITGVSGSGKSSLLKDVLFSSIRANRPQQCEDISPWESLIALETVYVDQSPLLLSRSSTPVSYLGILSDIQTLYASQTSAKTTGLKKADFSYLSKKGKCPSCNGYGKIQTSLDFMSDVWTPCEMCNGSRYNNELNKIEWQNRDIGTLLKSTVREIYELLPTHKLGLKLKLLVELGLGHLHLGQSASTLSGGESQRIKLAKALLEKTNGPCLFLLDEPSVGLHQRDLSTLMVFFQKLLDQGNSIICIDHNEYLISCANRVITLGPGSGSKGGELI